LALKQDNSSGYTALGHGAGLIDWTGTGRILLTGADRRSYLQGLLTNDIEALAPGTGCYAAMLTAQGRMMTDMRVLELGDAVLLDVPAQVTAQIRDHLDRFVFSEDVQVEDVTTARGEIGIFGPGALDVLVKAGIDGAAPASLFATTRVRFAGADVVLVRSDEAGIAGYGIVVDAARLEAVTAALMAAGAVPVSEADAEAVRIEAGRPRFGVDMDTDTIPLEAGSAAGVLAVCPYYNRPSQAGIEAHVRAMAAASELPVMRASRTRNMPLATRYRSLARLTRSNFRNPRCDHPSLTRALIPSAPSRKRTARTERPRRSAILVTGS
jgi:folate-binding Fe-S cluster repair protein YgfZ